MYIAESDSSCIRKVTASTGIITTIVSSAAGLSDPNSIVLDSLGKMTTAATPNTTLMHYLSNTPLLLGNLYIADFDLNLIVKVALSSGIISTIAGTGSNGFSGDGGQATAAELNGPEGLTVDSSGIQFLQSVIFLTSFCFLRQRIHRR